MNKAVFLDRDGVINREMGEYTFRESDFHFNEGIEKALRTLQERGFLIIVITNQGGIAKGIYSREDVERLHLLMTRHLEKHGIHLTGIYYCPHHSDMEACLCRKPGTLLLEKALSRFHIDRSQSYFIGDHDRDMQSAEEAGIRGIRITPNQNLETILHRIGQ